MQMTVEAPERSLSQRLAALEKANEVRIARSRIKRQLAAGEKTVHDVLADPVCGSMKVYKLLVALPKVGRVKAERALLRAQVSPSKTLAGMTERQRRDLLALLPVEV